MSYIEIRNAPVGDENKIKKFIEKYQILLRLGMPR